MPIFGAGELKLFLSVKRKYVYTIGNKYFLVKWGYVRYVANVLFFLPLITRKQSDSKSI